MTEKKKVWFITGAGRGMGVDIARAALDAGRAVVASGRNTEAVVDAVGDADDLLVVELDITSLTSAEAAVQSALDRFSRIDLLVNNAGNFYAGFFEELAPEQMERQLMTNLLGPMNVTRAVLPVMRKQRSGHVVTMSSTAGIAGQEDGRAEGQGIARAGRCPSRPVVVACVRRSRDGTSGLGRAETSGDL